MSLRPPSPKIEKEFLASQPFYSFLHIIRHGAVEFKVFACGRMNKSERFSVKHLPRECQCPSFFCLYLNLLAVECDLQAQDARWMQSGRVSGVSSLSAVSLRSMMRATLYRLPYCQASLPLLTLVDIFFLSVSEASDGKANLPAVFFWVSV